MSLCFRCERRAEFLEGGTRPRYECGEAGKSVSGCYMYRPVRPVVLGKDDDIRPQFGPPIIASRSRYVGLADMELLVRVVPGGAVLHWVF